MTRASTVDPAAAGGRACARALEQIRAFSTGQLSGSELAAMRAHVTGCAACARAYRGAMETAAALGGASRARREQRRARARRENQRHLALAGGRGDYDGRRRFRLRTILLPAFFAFLIVQILGIGAGRVRLDVVEARGAVTVGGRAVEELSPEAGLRSGTWCSVPEGARLALASSACKLTAVGPTDLLIESAPGSRFRLRAGRVALEGDATVVTALGVAAVEQGAGLVRVDEAGVYVEPESGSWTFADPRGERAVAPGAPLRVAP